MGIDNCCISNSQKFESYAARMQGILQWNGNSLSYFPTAMTVPYQLYQSVCEKLLRKSSENQKNVDIIECQKKIIKMQEEQIKFLSDYIKNSEH